MTEAQQRRLAAYLDALRPHVADLRERGWPVEVQVEMTDEPPAPVVRTILAIDDTRVPIEASA